MGAKPEYRDRPAVEVDILDALVEHADEGMTVLELRAAVDADIDRLEAALSDLKQARLIEVERNDDRTVLYPADEVVLGPDDVTDEEPSLLDVIRRRLGF